MLATTVESRKVCPRCTGTIVFSYEEPCCLQCGYVDYHSPPRRNGNGNGHTSILNKGTEFILRYAGDSQWLNNRLATVKIVRVRNRVAYCLDCPFCGDNMEQASLSGRRKDMREERYKCPVGHRVSLIPSNNEGVVGWK